jgi:hypothetical protein
VGTNLLPPGGSFMAETDSATDPIFSLGFGSTQNTSGLSQNPDAPVMSVVSALDAGNGMGKLKALFMLAIAAGVVYYAFA